MLRRDLGLLEATTIIVGSMIGSGIFLGVGGAARLVGDGPTLLLVFLASGILVLFGALTYGEIASVMPESGGHYAYIRNGYGPLLGYLQGWNIFTIAKSASVAALAVAFAQYAQLLVPLGSVGPQVVALGLIAVLTVVNVLGVRHAGVVSNLSTFAKVGALGALVLLGLLLARTAPAAPAPAPAEGLGLVTAFGAAMVFAMFAYDGWINSTQVAEEVREPRRNVPRSLVIGVVLVMGVYLATVFVYLKVLGFAGLRASDFAAAEAAAGFGGGTARTLVILAVLVSILGTTNAVTLSGPRITYAMARDGLFPAKLAEVHPTFGTPAAAIVAQGVWSGALALSGTFEQLLTLVIFTSWIFYGLGAYVVILWRNRHPDLPREYRVPGYPVVPWVFVAASAVFTLNTLFTSPFESFAGVAILAAGLPGYWWFAVRPGRPAGGAPSAADAPAPLAAPPGPDEVALERWLTARADPSEPWNAAEAARVLGIPEGRLYEAVADLRARGRLLVRYEGAGIVIEVA